MGKKSWNVYNQDNIEKVKRDEAAAKAVEEAEEQRMQEVDAERRMQILRGEIPTPLEIEDRPAEETHQRHSHGSGRERNKRKRAGENVTDFEIRTAHDQTLASDVGKQIVLRKPIDAPLVDQAGHIDLFPQAKRTKHTEKNAEAEKETARKRKEYEDQYTMRFSNAAGFKQGLENPWYSTTAAPKDVLEDTPGKDVWGNEDPRRKERQAARIVSSDPLAMMRQGAAQVRKVEEERRRWKEEKEKEIRKLEEAEQRGKRSKRHHEKLDDEDDLEGFELDQPESGSFRTNQDEMRDDERRHRHKRKESRRSSHRPRDSSRHRHRGRDHRGE